MNSPDIKPGEWVLLDSQDNIIAHDDDVKKIMRLYDESKRDDLIISKNPDSDNLFY